MQQYPPKRGKIPPISSSIPLTFKLSATTFELGAIASIFSLNMILHKNMKIRNKRTLEKERKISTIKKRKVKDLNINNSKRKRKRKQHKKKKNETSNIREKNHQQMKKNVIPSVGMEL
jgi:hypothetical protein